MSCDHCPCPDICLRWPIWCEEWAPSGDPVLRAHIRVRSGGMAAGAVAPPVATRPPAREAIELARRMNACAFRNAQGCGCTGGRCALKAGATVSHLDCFECLRRYPEPTG